MVSRSEARAVIDEGGARKLAPRLGADAAGCVGRRIGPALQTAGEF
jgi:hypothetical protein